MPATNDARLWSWGEDLNPFGRKVYLLEELILERSAQWFDAQSEDYALGIHSRAAVASCALFRLPFSSASSALRRSRLEKSTL
ncbi:MAG: hypothetical protein M1608_17115 [Candidatus Omnitrophica bacterium]|nr:hypothetical protein [Candidatus Omnitrophota bacterium]